MGLDLHSDWQQQRHCLVTNSLPFPYYVAAGLDGIHSSQTSCNSKYTCSSEAEGKHTFPTFVDLQIKKVARPTGTN